MSWAGVGQGILDAFQGGPNAAEAQRTRIAQEKEALRQSQFEHDNAIAEMVSGGTLNPVFNGMVKRTTSSGPSAFQADAPIPGVPSAGGVPSQEHSYYDKADPSRVITHKTATGHTLQFEHVSPAEQLMSQFKAQAPLRQAMGQEADVTAARQGAEKRANAQADLEANGVPVGDEIADLVGLRHGQKLLPQQYDDLVRAAGSLLNYKSEAAKRAQPPPKKVAHSEVIKDDSGKSVQVTIFEDGTVEEKPLTAKGTVTAPKAEPGAATEFQKWRMNQGDKGQTASQAYQRATAWQTKIDKMQADKDKLAAENTALGEEMKTLGEQITPTPSTMMGVHVPGTGQTFPQKSAKERIKARARMNQIQEKITRNNELFKGIHSRQQSALTIKNAVMEANGIEQPSPNAAKTATQADVERYAQQFHMTPEAAAAAFKQDGIEVQ